jgi:hypothetical protein
MSPYSRFASQSSLRERCPIPRALLHSSFNVPGIRTPFQVPQRDPYGKRCLSPEPFLHIFQGPLPPGSPHKERDAPFTESFLNHLSAFPVNGLPPLCPNGAPMVKGARLQSLLHISPRQMSPLLGSPSVRHSRPLSPPPYIRFCNIASIANSLNTLEGTFV